jgi:hypothetical protein
VAFNTPFQPVPANTIALSAGLAPQSRQVKLTDFGLSYWPPQMRMVNVGTVPVWVWFSSASQTLVIPVAGTTTVGTPSEGIPLIPGIVEVFTLTNFQGQNLWVSDISTAAAQIYYLTPGEGL